MAAFLTDIDSGDEDSSTCAFQNSHVIPNLSPATVALHGWIDPTREVGERGVPLVSPLVQSTTYVQDRVGEHTGHCYSRVSNPTVDDLERVLGALEDAPQAVTFATGLAAETALFLSLLKAGDHAVLGDAIYGGTVRLFQQLLNELGISATFVDSSDPGQVARAITAKTRLVFIETPANPTLKLTDIAAIARLTKVAGIPLVVDNTFQTAVLQRPLDLGADISLYSTTKHIEGHSTALGGAVVSRDEKFLQRLRFIRKSTGAIQTPFNAWLTLRGIQTLPLRLRQHSENALEVAKWLSTHQGVRLVNYPGLESHPQHALAVAQHRNVKGKIGQRDALHGGVVSFEVVGGVEAGRAVLNSVKLCSLVEHIGSVQTLITHPATMTHGDVPREQREAVGITDGLIRLSVGIEPAEEIIADLEQAINRATSGTIAAATASVQHSKASSRGGAACPALV